MMSDHHKIQIIKDGTILPESEYRVLRCPYNSRRQNGYGYMDDDGYFKCNNSYCEDAACSYCHTSERDCITDRVNRGEWDEWEMGQFENDFCNLAWETDDDCAEWISLYQMLKNNQCMITDNTHIHYEALIKSQPKDAENCAQDENDGNGFTPEGIPKPDWYYNGHNSADWEAWCNSYRATSMEDTDNDDDDDDDERFGEAAVAAEETAKALATEEKTTTTSGWISKLL